MARSDFIEQLKRLGHEVRDLGDGKIAFPFTIPCGKFAGTAIQLGFVAKDDFPLNPPSGPHISPMLLPLNPGAPSHPDRVHESEFGSDWEYWSRPMPDWPKTDRTARAYLAHIRHLFDTQ